MGLFARRSAPNERRGGDGWLSALLALAFIAGGCAYLDRLDADAVVRDAIARELWRNTTVGRQALVASAWWPPFPILLRLPFVAFPCVSEGWPVASLLLSALAAAAALGWMLRRLRCEGLGKARYLVVLAVAVHPFFLEQALGGGPGPLVLLFALVAADGLAEWTAWRSLRGLVRLAGGSALLIGSSIEMAPWIAALYLCLLFDLARGPFERGQRGAALWLALLPPLAAAGFWVLMNWLIMGDAIYFLRGLLRHRELLSGPLVVPFPFSPTDAVVGGCALAAAAVAALRAHRAGVFLGLLAAAPVGIAAALSLRGLMGSPAPLLFVAGPLAVFAVARQVGTARRAPTARIAALAVAFGLTLAAAARWPERSLFAPARRSYATLAAQRRRWLPPLESHVRAASPFARVFVAGYESFELLDAPAPELFVPALDLDFAAVERDYAGNQLYVLVRRPEGRGAMDSIHWKYPRMYEWGSRYTLYDSDWGDWRLFEIVQPRSLEEAP